MIKLLNKMKSFTISFLLDIRTIFRIVQFGSLKYRRIKSFDKNSSAYKLLKFGLVHLKTKVSNLNINSIFNELTQLKESYEKQGLSGMVEMKNGVSIERREGSYPDGSAYDTGYHHVFGINNFNFKGLSLVENESKKILTDALGRDVVCYGYDAYISENSIDPRSMHMDGVYSYQYKTFIHITDVKEKDGPYTYLLGSHLNNYSKIVYLIKNLLNRRHIREIHSKKEERKPLYDVFELHKSIAPKGNAILSDQHGFHGGTKQDKDGYRMLIVLYWSDNPMTY